MVRALILASLAWMLLSAQAQPVGERGRGNSTAAERNQGSDKDANVASPSRRPSGDEEARAANEQAEKAEQTQRERRDVRAQEDMAYWAQAMFWAAFSQAILSAVGIVLIFVTFKATRQVADSSDRMVKEAAEATRAAVEANRAVHEANHLTREAQKEARSKERSEARRIQRREELAEKRAEASYTIASRSAEAAAAQVAVVQDTAKRELRAYVGVEEISFSQFGDPSHRRSTSFNEPYRLYVTLKNYGKTPAVLTWDAKAQRGGRQPRPASLAKPGGAPQILQPGRAVRRIFAVKDIEGGERRLFAIIRIFYRDIYRTGYGHRIDYASTGEEVRNSYLERTHEEEKVHPPPPMERETVE